MKIEYDRQKLLFDSDDLLKRAIILFENIKGYIPKTSDKYISIQEECDFQNSLRHTPSTLAKYINYKLILLLEKSASFQILKLTNEFIVTSDFPNLFNVYWMNSYNLQYKLMKKLKSDNYYKSGQIGNILIKSFREKKFTERESKEMLENSKNSKEYFKIMEENYEILKKRIFKKREDHGDLDQKNKPQSRRKTKAVLARRTKTFILDENRSKSPVIQKKTDSGSASLVHGVKTSNFLKKKITELLVSLKQQVSDK